MGKKLRIAPPWRVCDFGEAVLIFSNTPPTEASLMKEE